VRDGVLAAKAGLPAVVIVTEMFKQQSEFIARSVGMPGIPRAIIPHPCSGTGIDNLRREADSLAPKVISLLKGTSS